MNIVMLMVTFPDWHIVMTFGSGNSVGYLMNSVMLVGSIPRPRYCHDIWKWEQWMSGTWEL